MNLLAIWKFIGENVEGVIAVSALIVSVGSLWQNKRHNRLSVKPILSYGTSALHKEFILQVINAGFGPAIICQFEVHYNNVHIQKKDGSEAILEALLNIFSREEIALSKNTFHYFHKTSVVLPGQSTVLLNLDLSKWDTAERLQLLDKINSNLDIQITYKSFYGEVSTACSKV